MFTRGKSSFVSALAVILAVLCISGSVVGINYALDSGVAWAQQSYWTKTDGELYPSETESIIIGDTTEANADIYLNANGSAVFNKQGNDSDFRIAGKTDGEVAYPNLFCTDAENKYVGIGTNAPQAQLHILESGNTLVVPTDTIWLMQHSGSAGDSGYMGIVGGSTGDVGIWFGDETMPVDGKITYENDTDDLVLDATDDIVLDCDTIDLDGGQTVKRTAMTSGGTLSVEDYYIGCDTTSGAFTATLPAAATAGAGRMYIIANETGGNTVTVDGYSTETIDGSLNFALGDNAAKQIICSGTEWFSL